MKQDMICLLQMGELQLAIPVNELQEVLFLQDLTTIPNAPPYLAGLLTVRGQILTLLDLTVLWQECPWHRLNPYVAIITLAHERCALLVDEAHEVCDAPEWGAVPSALGKGIQNFCMGFDASSGWLLLKTEYLFKWSQWESEFQTYCPRPKHS